MTVSRKLSSQWNKYFQYMYHFRLLVFFVIGIVITGAADRAMADTPNRNESTLRTVFEKLKMKRSAMGGVVLRGDTDYSATRAGFLDLTKSNFFTVFPGTSRIRLMWNSTPGQIWEISFVDQKVQVSGGQVELQIPSLDAQGIYSWSLRAVDRPGLEVMGNWFYLQNINSTDAQEMLDLVSRSSHSDESDSALVDEVCQWMRAEALVHQNQYCLFNLNGVAQ